MIIKEIRLLTEKEFNCYQSIIPHINTIWWLMNPYENFSFASIIMDVSSSIGFIDKTIPFAVRPVLILEHFSAPLDNKLLLFDYKWTVLDVNPAHTIILCDSIIGHHIFDNKRNDWSSSDIKKYLEHWLSQKIADSEIVVTYKNKTEFMLLQSLCKKYNLNELCSNYLTNINYLIYSPYQPWRIAPEIPAKPILSFEDFCEYITKENSV